MSTSEKIKDKNKLTLLPCKNCLDYIFNNLNKKHKLKHDDWEILALFHRINDPQIRKALLELLKNIY